MCRRQQHRPDAERTRRPRHEHETIVMRRGTNPRASALLTVAVSARPGLRTRAASDWQCWRRCPRLKRTQPAQSARNGHGRRFHLAADAGAEDEAEDGAEAGSEAGACAV